MSLRKFFGLMACFLLAASAGEANFPVFSTKSSWKNFKGRGQTSLPT